MGHKDEDSDYLFDNCLQVSVRQAGVTVPKTEPLPEGVGRSMKLQANAHLFETGPGPRRRGIVVVLNNEIRQIGEQRYTFLASFALQLRQKFRRHFDFSLPRRSLVVLIHTNRLRKRSREDFNA